MTWGTWVLLSQKSPTIWSYIRGEKFKKRHFSTVFSSYSWFQLKLLGISAYTTFADIEKYLSSYVTFLIGRKPLGVHWELGCQMFWDCWKVQRRNINRLKHKKNNVCSLRLPAHTRDNRILKERRGKGKHEQALTRCQSKAAAFTLTMKKIPQGPESLLLPHSNIRAETSHLPHSDPHVTCGIKYNGLAVSVWVPVTFQHLPSFYDVVLGSVCFRSSHQKKCPAGKRRNKTNT